MPPQIHIISCTKQKQNPQFPSCFLAERKQQAGIITFAVTIWHKWGLPSSWRFLTLPASDAKLGWLNPSSEFLNWETENGSSCTRRFWGCQWPCLQRLSVEEVSLWQESARKPAFMETQMKAKKEIGGILTLVLAVQRQWYNPALPVGPLLACSGSNQVSVTGNQSPG